MLRLSASRRAMAYVLLGAVTLVSLLPTIYMLDLSLRNSVESFAPVLFAPDPSLQNYGTVLASAGLMRYFVNSLAVATVTVLLTLLSCLLAGFAISRLRVRGGNVVFYIINTALMVPLASLLIPLTVSLKQADLLNNYWGLIGPYTALGIPFGLLVIKGALDGFPGELEEAAVIDGASPIAVLLRIIVPVIRPSLLVVAIWQFLFSWNEFFLALVVMTKNSMKTMPLLPLYYEGSYMTNPGDLFAILTLVSIVPMIVYIVVQRWFVSGLMEGSVKG
ncbi:MAG: carbohydrate ABC transporter permease [Bacilli bacterium]